MGSVFVQTLTAAVLSILVLGDVLVASVPVQPYFGASDAVSDPDDAQV